jgi:carbonic anhydrase
VESNRRSISRARGDAGFVNLPEAFYHAAMRTLVVVLVLLASLVARADTAPATRSPDDALKALVAGNQRFVAGGASCPRQTPERRHEVASAQHPIAIVVGCADSRVPPEAIFGQGIGDLFVIRVAGNVVDDDVLGSIEYAVEHLGVSLVVVLGHERCGAVQAALASERVGGHVDAIVRKIRAAIEGARTQPDPIDAAVRANVAASVKQLQSSTPVLAPLVQQGRVKVVGARYDLDTGAVEMTTPAARTETH